jgi:hypothetical protein
MVIDIDTGAYEIDEDELVASDRLFARNCDAQLWVTRHRCPLKLPPLYGHDLRPGCWVVCA